MIRIFFSDPNVYDLAKNNHWPIQDVGRIWNGGLVSRGIRFCTDTDFRTALFIKLTWDDVGLWKLEDNYNWNGNLHNSKFWL